ncbi:hypothetical protein A2U01_0079132 [Trifolium medium]|uniref:Uncharacterized protein n=1 Tax=Trifolium medium TaxID=97028 RepID=A0A392T9V5_9FABA|nr:hypothetical protein [Trifolium medium]
MQKNEQKQSAVSCELRLAQQLLRAAQLKLKKKGEFSGDYARRRVALREAPS